MSVNCDLDLSNRSSMSLAKTRNEPAGGQQLRLLVLGGGAVVREYHLPALKTLGWLTACTVVEASKTNAQGLRDRFPEIRVVDESYQTFLSREEILKQFDGALIALPNTLHVDATRQCLEMGLHVLCEKPLALSAPDCEALAKAASRAERLLVVGMVRRCLPSIAALRKLLAEGRVGEVTRVRLEDGGSFNWTTDMETLFRHDQGGVLVNMGVHFLDLLQWILGDLQPVSYADDCSGGIEVNCTYEMRTKTGAPVQLKLSWTHALQNIFEIVGTRSTVIVRNSDCGNCQWESADGTMQGQMHVKKPFQSGAWPPTLEASFVEQLWRFALTAKTPQDGVDLVHAVDAARTQRLIDWAYAHRRPKYRHCGGLNARPGMEPGPVVVVGGTGFVGTHLVARLTQIGAQVTVPVRRFSTAANVARYPVTMKRIDLLNEQSCRESLKGARHVFHLAYGRPGKEERKVTVEGTLNIVRAAIAERVESIVVFSTTVIYGNPDVWRPIDESFPLDPRLGVYGSSKARMHQQCLKIAREAGSTRVVVITPGAVIGPGGALFCEIPCELAEQGRFCWIDDGEGIANYTSVGNLVDAAILAATQPSAHGQDFIIVDGQCSWKELLGPLVEPWSKRIPSFTGAEFARMKRQSSRNGTLKDVLRAALSDHQLMAAISNHPALGWSKESFGRFFPRQNKGLQGLRPTIDPINAPRSVTKPRPASWLGEIFGNSKNRFTSAKARRHLCWEPLVSLIDAQKGSIEWLHETGLR